MKSLFNKVQAGELQVEGFKRTLWGYESERIELRRNAGAYTPTEFQSKLKDLDLAIGIAQVFVDKFEEIKKGLK